MKSPLKDGNKIGLLGWIIQEIGTLLLRVIGTAMFGFIAYAMIVTGVVSDGFWFILLLFIIDAIITVIGIASIIIGICNIVYLIKEFHNNR